MHFFKENIFVCKKSKLRPASNLTHFTLTKFKTHTVSNRYSQNTTNASMIKFSYLKHNLMIMIMVIFLSSNVGWIKWKKNKLMRVSESDLDFFFLRKLSTPREWKTAKKCIQIDHLTLKTITNASLIVQQVFYIKKQGDIDKLQI